MRAPGFDPLATRAGRLSSFFLLYVSEGLPYGFTATAVATQMRRLGIGPAEIGAFVGALYLPWAFKWIAGPIVDTLTVHRFGPRRFWIVLAQTLMTVSLLVAMPVDMAGHLGLFTALIIVVNVFSATQDVAIDALACDVLPADERGLASGFMFGGQAIGIALGSGGVLFLTSHMPFRTTFLLVAAAIVLIGIFVSWRLRERSAADAGGAHSGDGGAVTPAVGSVARRLLEFVRATWRAFAGSRAASLGLIFAVLPLGAMGLGLALRSTLAVELGLSDNKIGVLSVLASVASALGCVVGGWLSDHFGRRRMTALFVALMSVPTLAMMLSLSGAGIVEAVVIGPGAVSVPRVAPPAVIGMFWAAVLFYNLAQGLMYGASTALFMDITTKRVAATQFTAYMALNNLAISFSAFWQGIAIERFGYPVTLGLDAVVGIVGLAILPFIVLGADARRSAAETLRTVV
jgi:MFS family permease